MEEIKSLDDADYGYDQDSYTHNDEWCLQSRSYFFPDSRFARSHETGDYYVFRNGHLDACVLDSNQVMPAFGANRWIAQHDD